MSNGVDGLPTEQSSRSFWHSEPSKTLLGYRSTADLPKQADVVIVGSGISGTSAAWKLLRGSQANESLSVVMLEAREACWGATGRNGGHCQPIFYNHPRDVSIGHFEIKNLHAIDDLVRDRQIDCEWNVQPAVRGIYTAETLAEARKSLEILQEADPTLAARIRFVFDPAGLGELRVPTALAAIRTDIAARMWPYKFVTHLLEDLVAPPATGAQQRSLNLQTHTPVTSLSRADEVESSAKGAAVWKLTTPRGTIVTSNVILATNGYTTSLVPEFEGLIVPCRGQMSALIPPPDASGRQRITNSYVFAGHGFYDYLIQRPSDRGEHLMFGGGGKKGSGMGIVDDSTIDARAAKWLRQRLYDFLDLYVSPDAPSTPELEAPYEWTGIMGYSRDNMPWIGPVPSYPGVFMAAAYTGHGMPNAFLCGQAVAVMVQSSLKGLDEHAVVQAAIEDPKTALPPAYVISLERIERAQKMDSIERQEELAGL